MVENIRAELHLKRTLPVISVIVKDDIVLNEGVAYTVALIKDTLKNLKIQVEEDSETVEVDDSNLFKVTKITDDESDKVIFSLICRFSSASNMAMVLKMRKSQKQLELPSIWEPNQMENSFCTLKEKAETSFITRKFLTKSEANLPMPFKTDILKNNPFDYI